jgi:hypothetical protein
MTTTAEADRIASHFTRSDGTFRFSRWTRPLVPVVFGTDPAGEAIFTEALRAVAGLGGLPLAASDPELGANFLVFFCAGWDDLAAAPGLARLVPDLDRLLSVLKASGANQYRIFGFAPDGAIRLCLVLLRYDADLQRVSAQTLAVSQAVQALLLWSDTAFTAVSPVAVLQPAGRGVVKPWHADLLRAAYDPTLPDTADDPAFALRLSARMARLQAARETPEAP